MKKNAHDIAAGLFVVTGLLLLGYMTIHLGKVSLLGDDSLKLTARFNSVSGLRVGSPIEMYGIEVGVIEALAIDQENQMAKVTLKINKDTDVYSDAIASIKTAGLIGDKFLSLDPGGSGEILGNGGVIINTESPSDLGELIGKYAFGSVREKPAGINRNNDEEIK